MNKDELTKNRSLPVNKKNVFIIRSKFSDHRQVIEVCSSAVCFELQVDKGLSVGCTSILKVGSGVVHIMFSPRAQGCQVYLWHDCKPTKNPSLIMLDTLKLFSTTDTLKIRPMGAKKGQ